MNETTGTMLVVDDEALNRTLLSVNLKEAGYMVETANNGRQALELLQTRPFDVILLDLLMPEMDGYQVLEKLKGHADLRHIPVIVISALDEMESVIRCIETGATDYLSKPFDPVLLRARVNASLARKRMHDLEISLLKEVQKQKQRADDLLNIVIPIGVALARESNLDQLLEKILLEAMTFSHADAGHLYIRTSEDTLELEILRTISLAVARGGTSGRPVDLPPVLLPNQTSNPPDTVSAVVYATQTGHTVNIPDIDQDTGFDFATTRARDKHLGYRSVSTLIAPIRNPFNRIIGVLELINAQSPETGQPVPFDRHMEQMIGSLSLLAAVALDAYTQAQQLRQQVAQLQIQIDQAKAARQVAEITETDYFQELQQEIKTLREQGRRSGKNSNLF